MQNSNVPTRTLAQVDQEFESLGCLGHGGMASVFLARKISGRQVALKVFKLNSSDQEDVASFMREVHAISRLQNTRSKDDSRDLGIVFFEDWFMGVNFGCIVMNHANGGTLAQEICSRNGTEPYAERRIGWYALQLSEALAFAHERGVAHFDVKSSNCLIDLKAGGRVLLADFGSAVAPGEDPVGFSEVYASPELAVAHANEDYSGLEADKVDAFGLGCILFELVCCKKLVDLTGEQTLAEYIATNSVDSALGLSCVRLPWLSDNGDESAVGYSIALKGLIKTLLENQPCNRWTPSALQKPLRNFPLSPLMANTLVAAKPPTPGSPVTIDNVQLGMFVQRGPDWDEDDAMDGGAGSIGVIATLDPDGLYAHAVWPSRTSNNSSLLEPLCCRIGAGNRFELQVGPTPMNDFVSGTGVPMKNGVVKTTNASNYSIGQLINENCMVVGIRDDFVLAAPMERINISSLPAEPAQAPAVPRLLRRKPQGVPEHWEPCERIMFVEVRDMDEKREIIDLFHSTEGGLDIQAYEITAITRVQSRELWHLYSTCREDIAAEYWGIANEQRLFIGTGTMAPEPLLCNNAKEFYQKFVYDDSIRFSTRASWANENGHRKSTGEKQIVLSRVALGRTRYDLVQQMHTSADTFHSVKTGSHVQQRQIEVFIRNAFQAFPEYLISYRQLQGPSRRIISARFPQVFSRLPRARDSVELMLNTGRGYNLASTPRQARTTQKEAIQSIQANDEENKPSSTKMCVVCLSKPVCRILLPCGHPCLCEICSTEQGLAKLKRKCPECRSSIREAAKFYGRVVND